MFAVLIERFDHLFFALIDYMEQIKQLLFSITKKERETIREKIIQGQNPWNLDQSVS